LGPSFIVVYEPLIEFCLEFFVVAVDALSEGHPVELILDSLVETLADAVGLRVLYPGAGMVDVLQAQEQLVGIPRSGVKSSRD
jgi:hypothetical protein